MDRSFKAYAAQSPTMQTLAVNRRLWKINVLSLYLCLVLFV